MKIVAILFANMLTLITLSAQMGTAPDFNVTDVNGNSFHLYEELDAGRPVILACMATWSEQCYSFHDQFFLEELYQDYGPEGTNQIRVLFYEGDANTTIHDLMGTSGNTIEDWIAGRTYPFVNETNIQIPLDTFATQGFPSVKIIRPSDYEIITDVSCAESTGEIKIYSITLLRCLKIREKYLVLIL